MSLSTALNIAQNSLLNSQRQTATITRNVANEQNPDYARRSAVLTSLGSGARAVEIRRATDAALFTQTISSLSSYVAQATLVSGLEHLSININGVDHATSPAALLGQFQEALQLYSATPSNRTLADNAVESARQMVDSLNQGTNTINAYRTDVDSQLATAVGELNSLLAEFKIVNDEIKGGSGTNRDVNDALDKRDALLKKIAEYVPISTITRSNNDMMIVTADGTTLFETNPRHVSFTPQPAYGPNTTGNKILIDGVPMGSATGANTSGGGKIAALVQMRDVYAVGMQQQLDEIARGLIISFAEANPADATDVRAGLFTWSGAPDIPADGATITGLAGQIKLAAAVDPNQGGDAVRLRDGIAFNQNPDGNASFSGLLIGFTTAMDTQRSFVSMAGTTVTLSLSDFTTASISWFEDARKTANQAAETKGALMMRTAEALSNVTNVNRDEELALILDLEQSYAASAKMLQVINEMLKTLLDAVR